MEVAIFSEESRSSTSSNKCLNWPCIAKNSQKSSLVWISEKVCHVCEIGKIGQPHEPSENEYTKSRYVSLVIFHWARYVVWASESSIELI